MPLCFFCRFFWRETCVCSKRFLTEEECIGDNRFMLNESVETFKCTLYCAGKELTFMEMLPKWANLRCLDLHEFKIIDYEFIDALRCVKKLDTLLLSCCSFGDAGAIRLAKVLPELPQLATLQLARNGIVHDGFVAVLTALGTQTTTLLLETGYLGDGLDPLLVPHILKLKHMKKIVLVNFCFREMDMVSMVCMPVDIRHFMLFGEETESKLWTQIKRIHCIIATQICYRLPSRPT